MPYALCPMPYALCRIVPHLSEKGYNLCRYYVSFGTLLSNDTLGKANLVIEMKSPKLSFSLFLFYSVTNY